MGKKVKRLIALLLGCALIFSYCSYVNPPLGYQKVTLPSTYSLPAYIGLNEEEDGNLYLTRSQALEDFDYMWTMLTEGSPLIHIIRQGYRGYPYGDIKRAVAQMRRAIERQERWEVEEFAWVLNRSFGPLLGKGHFSVIDTAPFYSSFLDTFERYQEESYAHQQLYQVASNPKSKETYLYIQRKEEEWQALLASYTTQEEEGENPATQGSAGESPHESHPGIGQNTGGTEGLRLDEEYTASDLSAAIYGEMRGHTGIITIRTVLLQKADEAVTILLRLLREYQGARDLIIDIRGNSGGNAEIFFKGLVKPLTAAGGSYEVTYGFKESLLTKYYRIDENTLSENEKDKVKYYYGVSSDSLFTSQEKTVIDPSPLHLAFGGNLWLLVDDKVASAGESFMTAFSRLGLGVTIGQTTAGAGNGGQPIVFPLLNSGLLVMYEDIVGFNENGSLTSLTGITPDVVVEEGEDALEVCLKLIEEGYVNSQATNQNNDTIPKAVIDSYLEILLKTWQEEGEAQGQNGSEREAVEALEMTPP